MRHRGVIGRALWDALDSTPPLAGSVKAGKNQLQAKFSREAFVAALDSGDAVPISVSGLLDDGRPFIAVDTIRVIGPEVVDPVTWTKTQSAAVEQSAATIRGAESPVVSICTAWSRMTSSRRSG